MPETQKQWIKRLEEDGWVVERGGNHQTKMCKPGCRPITLPENHRRAYICCRVRQRSAARAQALLRLVGLRAR